jgi:hypothetical protein
MLARISRISRLERRRYQGKASQKSTTGVSDKEIVATLEKMEGGGMVQIKGERARRGGFGCCRLLAAATGP